MAKYKVGDKVRIVSKRPQRNWNPEMDEWLGKTMTIVASGINENGVYYFMDEDRHGFCGFWFWYENMISGLAEPEREPCTVELRFDGAITTATLKRGGRDVKTAEARCNPKDTYSRAEGARVAVERLFEKKRKEDKPKESKPKVGDKFVVTGNRPFGECHHYFRIGEIVTLVGPEISCTGERVFKNRVGWEQVVRMDCVCPYKEKSK
nr:MAG TPA: Mind bomb SH3 repeat domain [Caudoviricetes sp.]